jgi:signal transduction histidine kinase
MRERLKERERIARELHDTLIQDVEALVLNLHALSRRFGGLDAVHRELSRIDQAAQRSLELARASVGGLRAVTRTNTYLKDVLQELAEQLAILYPSAYHMEVKGDPQDLQSSAAEEIVAIGREAILNAFRHAEATLILISIAYTARALELNIVDDGQGFAPETASYESEGHWGLRGMRERARGLRAQLTITSLAGQGTRVYMRVAATVAYSGSRPKGIRGRRILRWPRWLRVAGRS